MNSFVVTCLIISDAGDALLPSTRHRTSRCGPGRTSGSTREIDPYVAFITCAACSSSEATGDISSTSATKAKRQTDSHRTFPRVQTRTDGYAAGCPLAYESRRARSAAVSGSRQIWTIARRPGSGDLS